MYTHTSCAYYPSKFARNKYFNTPVYTQRANFRRETTLCTAARDIY